MKTLYNPSAFKKEDLSTLQGFIRKYNFATLVTITDSSPQVSHLPLILDSTRGEFGTLCGHLSRANMHWKQLESASEVLCIFNGPHGYISPSWYVDAMNVPTWNYAVVHARGKAKLLSGFEEIEEILAKTVLQQEATFEKPWNYTVPEDFRKSLVKGVLGFELEIESIEGKFKLSQNREVDDWKSAVKQVEIHYGNSNPELVTMMKEELEAKSK